MAPVAGAALRVLGEVGIEHETVWVSPMVRAVEPARGLLLVQDADRIRKAEVGPVLLPVTLLLQDAYAGHLSHLRLK
jgi:hypothetical protein